MHSENLKVNAFIHSIRIFVQKRRRKMEIVTADNARDRVRIFGAREMQMLIRHAVWGRLAMHERGSEMRPLFTCSFNVSKDMHILCKLELRLLPGEISI